MAKKKAIKKAAKPKKKVGRPSTYSQRTVDRLCKHIVNGGSLRSFEKIAGNPTMTTIMKWASTKPEFAEQYARAREKAMDVMAEEILAIADDQTGDTIVGERGLTVDAENIQRARLRVDTRKWLMSKLAPKKYGNQIDVTSSDGSFARPSIIIPEPAKGSADG